METYVAAFSRPGAMRAGFDDYRALDTDVAQDRESREAGLRVVAPLLVLWGEQGLPARPGLLDLWREYGDDVRGGALADCGHFVPEEQPDALLAQLLPFLADHPT